MKTNRRGWNPDAMLGVQALTLRGVDRGVVRRFRAIAQAVGATQPALFREAVEGLERRYARQIRFKKGRGRRGKA